MQISKISSVLPPFYEGDLTKVTTDHEFIGEDKEWYWEQFFLNEKGEVVAKFIQKASEEYQGEAEQLSPYRQDIFVLSYKIDENESYDIVQVTDLEPRVLNSYDYIEYGEEERTFRVEKDGLFGFIDINGVEIIKPQYKKAFSFKNGVAIVRAENGKCGLINMKNEVLIPFIHDCADIFGMIDGYCVFCDYEEDKTVSYIYKAYDSRYKLIYKHYGKIKNLAHGIFAYETAPEVYSIEGIRNDGE